MVVSGDVAIKGWVSVKRMGYPRLSPVDETEAVLGSR